MLVDKMRPIGSITERDVLRRVVEHYIDSITCKANQVMTPIVTTTKDTSVDEDVKLMTTRKVRKVAVLCNQTTVGIVTTTDLLNKDPA